MELKEDWKKLAKKLKDSYCRKVNICCKKVVGEIIALKIELKMVTKWVREWVGKSVREAIPSENRKKEAQVNRMH